MSFKKAFSCANTAALQHQLIKHQKLLPIIIAACPRHTQAHIKDCVISDRRLIVYVSSASWASQIRFCATQIRQAVNTHSNEKITQLRVRILTPEPFEKPKKVNKIIPSQQSIRLIRNNADSLAESKLKSALFSLSRALNKHSQ